MMPHSTGMIPPIYARQLRMLLQQALPDGKLAWAKQGLDWSTLMTDDSRLSRETVTRLATDAMDLSQRPWLGLDLAAMVPVTAHGPLGSAVVTAANLQTSLEAMVKYCALRNDAFVWSMSTTAQGMVVQGAGQADWGTAHHFVIDMLAGTLLYLIKAAFGYWPTGLQLDLPLASAPPWADEYARFAPVQISFNKPIFALHVSQSQLAQPCIGAEAHGHAAALAECARELVLVSGASLSERVFGLLSDSTTGHYPQLGDVAQHFHLSPRTFMRHLQSQGTSFQALLDSARQSKALKLLQHSEHSVEEIAGQLGYVDTSNFSRTVRRWFGLNPSQIRLGGYPAATSASDLPSGATNSTGQ